MWGWHDGSGTFVWMALMMVLFWGGLAAVIVLIVRAFASGQRNDRSDARTILESRYARGEIDEDEFRRRLDVLDGRKT